MRRGLISWDKEEVPVSVLQERVARLQAAMKKDGLGLVLGYTSFAQPAVAHWICNFIPYWSEALVAVLPEGRPFLLASLTKRVHPWMREVSHVSEVISAPRLGAAAVRLIDERVPSHLRVGIVGLDEISYAVMQPIQQAGLADRLVDSSLLFRALRQPADDTEAALARRATDMVRDALSAVPAAPRMASEATSAIERSARLAGAEEVLQRVAPDLRVRSTLERMEGDAVLGPRYAIEVSLAYKGAWVRVIETRSRDPRATQDEGAAKWFEATVAQIAMNRAPRDWPPAPGTLARWTIEACTGMHPLSVVAASDGPAQQPLPEGSLAIFCAELTLPEGAWLGGTALRIDADASTLQSLGA